MLKRLFGKIAAFVGAVALVGCSLVNDPVRIALFTAKETYLSARETAIVNHSKGFISDSDLAKFKAVDAQIVAKHNELVELYLAAKPITDQARVELDKLIKESCNLSKSESELCKKYAEVQ